MELNSYIWWNTQIPVFQTDNYCHTHTRVNKSHTESVREKWLFGWGKISRFRSYSLCVSCSDLMCETWINTMKRKTNWARLKSMARRWIINWLLSFNKQIVNIRLYEHTIRLILDRKLKLTCLWWPNAESQLSKSLQ